MVIYVKIGPNFPAEKASFHWHNIALLVGLKRRKKS
jgi:hypothetical protein